MENNILQTLTSMLGGNNNQPQANTKPQNTPPLYPVEAYSTNNQSNNFDNQTPQSSNLNKSLGGNNLLPLLLSMMGNKGESNNLDMLSSLLSTQNNSSGDANNLLDLFSSLNKKKKEDEKKDTPQQEIVVTEGEIPKNEIL